MTARFAFVFVFQNIVALSVMLINWCIPDVPRKLSERIRQEAYFTNEIIIKQEMIRAKGSSYVVQGDATAWDPRPPCSNGNSRRTRRLNRSASSDPWVVNSVILV